MYLLAQLKNQGLSHVALLPFIYSHCNVCCYLCSFIVCWTI